MRGVGSARNTEGVKSAMKVACEECLRRASSVGSSRKAECTERTGRVELWEAQKAREAQKKRKEEEK